MKAPEKIFICDYGSELGFEWHSESDWEHDIEYTRTDAFIKKACKWIKYNTQNGGCLFDGWKEDFKKFMED